MDFMGFRGGAGLYQSVGRRNGHVGGVAEVRAALALKSHSEAERRRRERINSHLSTLRRLIPNTSKVRCFILACRNIIISIIVSEFFEPIRWRRQLYSPR